MKPRALHQEPVGKGAVGEADAGEQIAAIKRSRPVPLPCGAERGEFHGVDGDGGGIEGDGLAICHQRCIADEAPQLGQRLAQAAARQLFVAVAPQQGGQLLARPAEAGRQRQQSHQGPQFPAGESKTAAIRADELEAPQHAHAHWRRRQRIHVRVTRCVCRRILGAIHGCGNSG